MYSHYAFTLSINDLILREPFPSCISMGGLAVSSRLPESLSHLQHQYQLLETAKNSPSRFILSALAYRDLDSAMLVTWFQGSQLSKDREAEDSG